MALATPDDLRKFGYDVGAVAPLLLDAETRVRTYLTGRKATLSGDNLARIVCAVADRVRNARDSGATAGVKSESVGDEQIVYGLEFAAAASGLTANEMADLDRLYPKVPFTIFADPR